MTYCIGLNLDHGLILASDSRTNAGVDDIRRTGKMRVFAAEGEYVVCALSAGNLSLTQNALNLLEQRSTMDGGRPGIGKARSMFDVAQLIGDALREVRKRDEAYLRDSGIDPSGSFIVGGQIRGEAPRLFLVYSEGNFIESSTEMPYFQTGESKFGKPILDRVITQDTSLAEACKCVLVSFDSTMRSNLSVGPPLDLLLYRRDSFSAQLRQRLVEDDPYLQTIRREWNDTLRRGVRELPGPAWLRDAD
jgi:putative proteasome-type protease